MTMTRDEYLALSTADLRRLNDDQYGRIGGHLPVGGHATAPGRTPARDAV